MSEIIGWNMFTVGGLLFVIFVMLIILFFLGVFLVKELASRDIFFTMVKEGSAKAIMGGGGSGFQRFIMHFKGYDFDKNWNVVKKCTTENKITSKLGLSGIKFLGIPNLHTIHKYTFRWNSLKQAPDDKTTDAGGIYFTSHVGEKLDYILLQSDVYYARVEGAEDKDMVPLDFDVTLEIKITNPYKACFLVQEWLEMTWGTFLPALRRFISKKTWEVLAGETEKHEDDFIKSIQTAVDKLKNEFGVEIVKFRILRIKPGGTRAVMYEEAATRQYQATQKAKEIITLAKAEQKRIQKVYGEIQNFNELGILIKKLESLENSSKGAGNLIISAPELTNLSSALGALINKKK